MAAAFLLRGSSQTPTRGNTQFIHFLPLRCYQDEDEIIAKARYRISYARMSQEKLSQFHEGKKTSFFSCEKKIQRLDPGGNQVMHFPLFPSYRKDLL